MGEGYILEWLDTLISVTLNPVKTDVTLLHLEEIAMHRNRIEDEKNKLMTSIKSLIFRIDDESKIKTTVKLYYSNLIVLFDQAMKNQIQNSKYPHLKEISEDVIDFTNEILSLIEDRFGNYLDNRKRLPNAYLEPVRKELLTRINVIEQQLNNYPASKPAAGTTIQVLKIFLNCPPDEHSFTFQEIEYVKELCLEMERLQHSEDRKIFSRLDELLIYMNFNSRRYLDNLTQRLTSEISSCEKRADKMERLLFYFKSFKQLPRKTEVIFNPKQPDLKKSVINWFRQEISYLEKKRYFSVRATNLRTQNILSEKPKQKVTCALSTDQTGLIIRAADELRILIAKSMSEVFKTIVPHLSTPYKKDLSYDGMRSKSYVAEERDKQIAIKTLQRIIKKIEEY
ncbi:MAG TPA: hypothetical protein DD434_01815 [Bacteroidales bacterium]|nr:hypothetical protein [Bacteroidales bacterium]